MSRNTACIRGCLLPFSSISGLATATLCAVSLLLSGCAARDPGDRHRWPLHWLDADGDCQDTETEVLIEQADGLITWADPEACTIADGIWRTWAHNAPVTMRQLIVVPLVTPGNATLSGATGWGRQQKLHFLNDRDNLIVLDFDSMKVRGDYGPDRWVPHGRFWCEYASRWERVKQRYGLTIGAEEQGAIKYMKSKACESPQSRGRRRTGLG